MALKDIFKANRENLVGTEVDENYGEGDNSYDYAVESDSQTSLSGGDSATIEMKVVKPTGYNLDEVKKYGDLLLQGKTVLLNLESTQTEDAKRLLDFLFGVVHAVDGKIEKVGKRTFVATPHNVDVTGSPDVDNDNDSAENE